jgi:hypothetical protein
MTIAYTVIPERQLVLVAWDGIVSLDQWRTHIVRMLGDPGYQAARLQLSDVRTASLDKTIDDAALHEMAEHIDGWRPVIAQKKIAILPGTDWDRAKVFEGLIAGLGARPLVFTNLSTACTWLGVNVGEVEAELARLRAQMRGDAPE